MTDSSYKARSNGERPVQGENDPLMQLAQIGGFEELFTAQSQHQDTSPSDDMFAIDLERELAGGLDDDFFAQDVPDVFAETVTPEIASTTTAAISAEDKYRDNYRTTSARSYASYNQGSHGYGSLTQHLKSQAAASVAATQENMTQNIEEPALARQAEAEEPYSYADHSFNADLEQELASALSGHEDVLFSHGRHEPGDDLHDYAVESQLMPDDRLEYTPPVAAVPAASLEDELANLLYGDNIPDSQQEAAPYPEASAYNVREENYEAVEAFENPQNIDDFAAQSSIEGGNYQPVSTQNLDDMPPQDMFFDDTSFAVEPSDIGLNALNQASAEFEATFADLSADAPNDNALDMDDENFSEAIERELSAQNYFAWEKDKVQPEDVTQEETADAMLADNFFTEQDLDFSVDDDLAEADAAEVAAPLTFAHAIPEEERKPAPFPHNAAQSSSFTSPAPDVATMSVSEARVEQTQPLDLPDVPYNEPENAGLNQLEAEFAEVFSAISVEDNKAGSDEAASADRAFEDIFRESYADFASSNADSSNAGLMAGGLAAGAAGLSMRRQGGAQVASSGTQDDFYNHWASDNRDAGTHVSGAASYATNENLAGEDLGAAAAAYRERPVRGRRAMLLATAAGALVLIGGIAYHFIGAGMNSGEPVIIRSDNQPVKVQPENPGGTTVPNQDKAVYERVAGTIPEKPEQKSLVSAQEKPVDLVTNEDEFGNIDEGRNDTITASNNNAPTEEAPLIVPRTVQTMVVRPDGTIVPQQAEKPSITPVAPEPEQLTAENIIESSPLTPASNATPAANSQANTPAVPARPVETQTFTPPVAPSRPAQPARNPTANPANNNVASAPQAPVASQSAVASAPAAAGGYFIQIASQPSAELAQKSFAAMGQKYANIIGGRAVDIRKADIPNKGTYYRVRIAAGSKADANALCERLKNAGGSCFVTQ